MAPNHRLKRARELRGWSQASVAQQIGTDATTVSRWERGLFIPTLSFRQKLCTLFEANVEELGLIATTQPLAHTTGSYSALLPQIGAFLAPPDQLCEENASEAPLLNPPSWNERIDAYSYILQSAAYDQRAYMLWKEAYVHVLLGERSKAQSLGEASLQAFERISHPEASSLREWLLQESLITQPVSSTRQPLSASTQKKIH